MKIFIDNNNVLSGDFRLGFYIGKVVFKIGKFKVCKTYTNNNKKFIETV